MKNIIFDLDLDFFFDDPKDWSISREKTLWNGAEDALQYFASIESTKRVLVIDHHEVLYHWDSLGFKSAYCIHADAHHDAFAKDSHAWRRPLGSRGGMVGVGDFIFQALREDIIAKMVWLTPPLSVSSDSKDSLNKILGSRIGKKVDVIPWPTIPKLTSPIELFTVSISPEWLNPKSEKWISMALVKLGFQVQCIEHALIQTRKRWLLCQDHAENMSAFRYKYPENYK